MSGTDEDLAFDPLEIKRVERSPYPSPYDLAMRGRYRRALGNRKGLTNFGVNLTELDPGSASSLRHWHTKEDEFIYIVEGSPTLVTNQREQLLRPGMCACFPANSGNGHRLENRSNFQVLYLEIGNRSPSEEVYYPDSDMILKKHKNGKRNFCHFDGTPY